MSTYKNKFNLKYNQPKDQAFYRFLLDEGVVAFRTRPDSVRKGITSEDQWAMARVYASVNPSSKAYKIDKVHLKKK